MPLKFACRRDLSLAQYCFNTYIAPISTIAKSKGIYNQKYADDEQLMLSFTAGDMLNKNDSVFKMENCISDLRSFLKSNQLSNNNNKSEFILLGNKTHAEKTIINKIKIGYTHINSCDEVKNIIISSFGVYGAVGVPETGVGDTWLRLTPALHAALSSGLALDRPHALRSVLMHSDHVFLGRPRPLLPGMVMLNVEFILDMARCTWPYHRRRRERSSESISMTPSCLCNSSEEISSVGLVAQIHLTMARSLRRSRCRSLGAQDSLPWSMAECTQAEKTLPWVFRDKCLEVRIGRSFLNLPQATQHLVAIARSHPPPAHSISPK